MTIPIDTTPLAFEEPSGRFQRAPAPPEAIEVLGVPVSAVDYDGALDWMDGTVAARGSGYVCVAATHTVMVAQEDPETMDAVLGASLVVPDGQPLVWALRALGRPLPDRVYGPDLMLRHCERAARGPCWHARQSTKGVDADLLDSCPPRGCRLASQPADESARLRRCTAVSTLR